MEARDALVEPSLQSGPLPSLRKEENTESQLANNDRIDGDLPLMCAKPADHARIGRRFRRLAQNVGVDKISSYLLLRQLRNLAEI